MFFIPFLLFAVSQNIRSTAGSPLAGKLFVVIGAGGAGKALAYGAKEKGARVVIANRTYGSVPAFSFFLSYFCLFKNFPLALASFESIYVSLLWAVMDTFSFFDI